MGIRGKASKTDAIYIAGLFDGEGHVFITEDMRPRYKTSLHILRVGITNTHKGVIDWLFSLFPTTLWKRVRVPKHPAWKTCYFWEASANNALMFLKTVYPYLRIKKEQTRLAIEFQEQWQDRRYLKNRDMKGRICKTPNAVYQKRNWYKREISRLNAARRD